MAGRTSVSVIGSGGGSVREYFSFSFIFKLTYSKIHSLYAVLRL